MKPDEKPRGQRHAVSKLAAQCEKCLKWRLIPTQEEFEEIRHTLTQNPFTCSKKSGTSCEDPADIEYDNTRTWVADKPNIPKSPVGFKRGVTARSDFSRMDAYYTVPKGNRKVRAPADVEKYLEEYPEYKDKVSVKDFNFAVPKIMEETLPKGFEVGSSKRKKVVKDQDD